MKPGDWICSSCGDLQFARNEACRKSEPKCSFSLGMSSTNSLALLRSSSGVALQSQEKPHVPEALFVVIRGRALRRLQVEKCRGEMTMSARKAD